MNANQGLILALYASFAGVLLLAGYIYKLLRDNRKRRSTPGFNFSAPVENVHRDAPQDHLASTH